MSLTLILFIIVILFLLLLIIFAGSAPTQSRRTRPHLERPGTSMTQPSAGTETEPRALPSPFAPSEPRALSEFFVPIPVSRPIEQPFQFAEAKRSEPPTPPPVFEDARLIFNWDSLCPVTGQSHRTCSCDECRELRSGYGVS